MELKQWAELLKQLEPASDLWARTWSPGDERIRAELYRQLMMNLALGYFIYFQANPEHPDFSPFLNSVFLLQPNPDDTYYYTPLRGDRTYRLSGDRGSVHLLTVTIGKYMMGTTDKTAPHFLEKDIDDLPRDAHGLVDILLSAKAPEGHHGAWLPLHPQAEFLMVRQRSYDWGHESDARLAIQCLDADTLKPRMPLQDVAANLEGMIAFAQRLTRFWLDWVNRLKATHALNTIHVAPFQQLGGLAQQVYWEAIFELNADEALILETDLPREVRYWNVQLNDELWNTLDYVYRQSSLNGRQARIDTDGRFRAVISAGDPAVPNWLDTIGHPAGTLIGRWYGASDAPMPTLSRVKLAEIRRYLPADTPVVVAEQRRSDILTRNRGAQLRRRW